MAALALTAQVGGILHWVAVQHVACAEHGEWVHSSEGPSAHSALASAGLKTVSTETPTAQGAAPAELGHGHDHCGSVLPRRDDSLAAATPFISILPPPSLQLPARRDHTLSSAPFSILSVAPKASPPRA